MGTHTKTTTKTKSSQARPVDWSLKPRGPVSATAQGVLALAALATVGDAVDLAPVWGCAATAAAAVGTVATSAHRQLAPSALMYRLACWIGAGSWWSWTLVDTPWSQTTWAALGIGALSAVITAPLGRITARRPVQAPRAGALVLRSTARLAVEWEARIRQVCNINVIVSDVRTWDNGAGYDVQFTLPPTGATRAQIATRAEALATAADLPDGCSVEVRGVPGAGRSQVLLRVSTVNRIAQTVFYPADYSPRSILEPLVLGEHANSDPAGAEVREEASLIAGKRGSGKTTLLQVISIALGRCRDNIVWHLDLNGGGLTQPWIDVWLDGRVQRCPIDWAAPNLTEGKAMITSAIAIAKHRKASYRKLKKAQNVSLLPVSATLPQITIVIDEGARAVADRDLVKLVGELQEIGRNEAVNLVLSSLRPTGDLVPVNMRKQSGVRVQMFGPDPEELGHMFGWTVGNKLSMDQLGGKGTGFLSVDSAPPRPFRGYNVLPNQIEEAALAIAAMRPDLDAASAQAAGPAYASRLERMRKAFADRTNTDDDVDADDVDDLEAPVSAPATQAGPRRLRVVPRGADAASWATPMELARGTRPAASTSDAANWGDPIPSGRLRAQQMHPVQGPATQAAPAAPVGSVAEVQPVPEILRRALATFDALGAERLHSEELAAALGIVAAEGKGDAVALADLLRPLEVRPLPNKFYRTGQERRGYARVALQTAAERVGHGEIEVPAAVAAWPAA
ncbi:hypothetical protein [Streptosporangium longisporum]|uniref:FtsK domain-containing protein n=1 Tax=Streptosporangium longisporum TaxID=46187 RepID=A0ABP6LCP5_9ACTN